MSSVSPRESAATLEAVVNHLFLPQKSQEGTSPNQESKEHTLMARLLLESASSYVKLLEDHSDIRNSALRILQAVREHVDPPLEKFWP